MLLREARVIARIDHPSIVPVYDFGTTTDGSCYIVSKYVKGKELRSEIRKPITHFEAAQITAALARALHAAHRAHVIHRDVKPSNIILDAQRKPHLLDFGLALPQQGRFQVPNADQAFVGTPAYMSPEQARCEGQLVDGPTDIYSLGVVFYEMLARRRPFQNIGPDEHLQHTDSAEVQPPRQFVDSIPRELEQICLKALSHKIASRHSTAQDFAEEIECWIDEASSINTAKPTDAVGSSKDLSPSTLRWRGYGQLPEGPSIAVLTFANLDSDPEVSGTTNGLTEEIITQLAKFKDLFILGRNATIGFQTETVDVQKVGNELGVDYLLTGSVRRSSDQLRVTAQLVDTSTMAHVWAKSFRGNLSTQDVFDIEDTIAEEVAVSLGMHHGVIAQTRKSARQTISADMDAYDSVTQFYENWRAYEPAKLYPKVRRDLESTVSREPGYFAAWAALAFVYLDGYVLDFGVKESPEEMLALAGDAALRAVEGSPQDARAMHALFRFKFHSGQVESFMDIVENAIAANPNETSMLADAANCLAALGDWDRALPLILKAIKLDPNPPVWYHATECWHALVVGDFDTAIAKANRMSSVALYWGPAFRACALAHLNRIEEAQEELRILAEMQPDFADRAAREMQTWNVCEELQNAIFTGLAKAGIMPD